MEQSKIIDTLEMYQQAWFYCDDVPPKVDVPGLRPSWIVGSSEAELVDVNVLQQQVEKLKVDGLTNVRILAIWMDRRIQPLEARVHPMYDYTGPNDPCRKIMSNY